MKTIRLLSLMMLGALLLTACHTEQKVEPVTIGLSVGPNQERWQKDKEHFISAASSMNAKVLIKEAQGDDQLQISQSKGLIDKGIDVLVIIPVNSLSSSEVVDYAHSKGVKVLAYDRIIKNCDLDFYVSFDNVKVGELQAEYLTKIKGQGNYVILTGSPDDDNSLMITLGQFNVIQPLVDKGDIKITLNTAIKDWSADEAYRVMSFYLSGDNPIPDAVLASSDPLAEGAIRALTEHGLGGKVLVSGQDAELAACKRIKAGLQTMTVYKYIATLAHASANTAVSLVRGIPFNTQLTVNNGKKMVPALLLPSMVQVNSSNIRMTVVADGFLKEEQIFDTIK